MSYAEFKNDYKWTLKAYPQTTNLFEVENITLKETRQTKTSRTAGWKTTETKIETINYIYYMNIVDAIPFFRNLGGAETVTKAYTKHGYIPTKIISLSPDKNDRTIREFIF